MTGDTDRGPRDPESQDPPEDLGGQDPALAAERTRLAWSRTGLAFLGIGGAVIKLAPIAGVAILVLGAVIWLLGYLERRWAGGGPYVRARRLQVIAYGTTAVSGVAFLVGLFARSHPFP